MDRAFMDEYYDKMRADDIEELSSQRNEDFPIEPMITKLQSRLCLRDWGYRIYLAETANLHQKKKNSGCCSTG